ncbi:MAG: anti-sigma factor antagonist [Clostridia bacterium]|nr:anti-sigma factor antagonist [Clostridia bacterium]
MSYAMISFHKETDSRMIFRMRGRVDSNNAAEVEKELLESRKDHPGKCMTIDLDGLEYISSAGLRVFMRLRKAEQEIELANVNQEIYNVLEMTGFLDIFTVHKAPRVIDVEGCKVVGRGGCGTVYRIDQDTIVKVYREGFKPEEIEQELQCAKAALLNGVPTAISYDVVHCKDGRMGIVYEMIRSDTLSHAYKTHPEQFEELTQKYVAFVRELHENSLPAGIFPNLKDVLHERANVMAEYCTPEEAALLHSLVDEMRDATEPIHGDLHPGNIMIQDGELLLIDMPEICVGPGKYDLVGVYRDLVTWPGSPIPEMRQKAAVSVDMEVEDILKIGKRFFEIEAGSEDEAAVAAFHHQMKLLFSFNAVMSVAQNFDSLVPMRPAFVERHLRGVIEPNEAALREALRSL